MSDRFTELYNRVLEDSDSVSGDELRELLALNAERSRSAARAVERQRIYDEAAARRARAEADQRRGTERIRAALSAGAKE
jgi:hypothetical protein